VTLRGYLKKLKERQEIVRVSAPISKEYEIAGALNKMEPKAVLFENVRESDFRVAGNLFCDKRAFANYFGVGVSEIIPMLSRAIQERSPCQVIEVAPCQEVVIAQPDLDALPILKHFQEDGGNYITSGVFFARHPEHGQNADFHRCMQFSKTGMAVRVVRGRHFDAFLNDLRSLDVAICIGVTPNVLAAAATSVEIGLDELEIANALEPTQLVRAKTVDLLVPAEAEIVLEGTVYRDRRHAEGPFVDLTGTYDVVRQEPVLEVKVITHRRDPIWLGLLPGGLEHKLLMGLPREPTIFREVNQVVRCLDVNISPGGSSWLHAIIQIDKQSDEDGQKAIQAAFNGHRSCKHVFVVDSDIDIYNPLAVEWAMATRFQGDRAMVIKDREPGSSLDPSAEAGSKITTKIGFDLTKSLEGAPVHFEKAEFPEIDLTRFIP